MKGVIREVSLLNLAEAGRVHDLPGRIVAKHPRNQRRVHAVTRAFSIHASENRHSKQRQIADYVHDLVTHELVIEPQPFAIQYPALGSKHNRILERAAAGESKVAQRLYFIEKPERARRRNLFGELPVGEFDLAALSSNHRM